MKPRILVADDDEKILVALKLLLKSEGMDVTAVATPATLLAAVRQYSFDLILLDLNYTRDTTSGAEGLALIQEIRRIEDFIPIVVMTGWATVDLAVSSVKVGANDFVQKPWDNERLLMVMKTQLRLARGESQGRCLREENQILRRELSPMPRSGIIAESQNMKHLIAQAEHLSRSDMNILLTGENGTGKSLMAEYLHRCSHRSDKPFISVNMGALSETLFESEMFGHVKGAFTDAREERIGRFQLAEGGTLFLDEIANVPLSGQAKLLRVLEERNYEKLGGSKTLKADVRLISATNADLKQLILEGAFRQDLLYRLNTVALHIPPLRERIPDICPLAEYFAKVHGRKYQIKQPELDASARAAMAAYSWPGNVRELDHLIERALFAENGGVITATVLGLGSADPAPAPELADPGLTLDECERRLIEQRLKQFKGNPLETARSLGLSRSAFYRRLQKHGL